MRFFNIKNFKCIALSLVTLFMCNINCQIQSCVNSYGETQQGTCEQIDKCTGAALIGNCQNKALICCIKDIEKPSVDEHFLITKKIFYQELNETTRNEVMYSFLVQSLENSTINNPFRAAAYLSAIIVESNYFNNLESLTADDVDNADDKSYYRSRGVLPIKGFINYEMADFKLSK